MDKTNRTNREYLFALCITDGLLEEMAEQQKSSFLLVIKEVLQEIDHNQNETK